MSKSGLSFWQRQRVHKNGQFEWNSNVIEPQLVGISRQSLIRNSTHSRDDIWAQLLNNILHTLILNSVVFDKAIMISLIYMTC